MGAEKNNDKKRKAFVCGCCDGTFEMIEGCFPDDAGYTDCLARMNENRGKFCDQKGGNAAKGEDQGCCG